MTLNKLGVLRDIKLRLGAAQTRNKASLKHIEKLDDKVALEMIVTIIETQESLCKYIEREMIKVRGVR